MIGNMCCKSRYLVSPIIHCLSNSQVSSNRVLSTSCGLRSKHYNQKFRKERGEKVLKVVLPNFQEDRENMKLSADEMRAKMKEKGLVPHRNWTEKPLFVGCTGDVFEPYVPPEGDGKISALSSSGIKQKYEAFGKKSKSYLSIRKIRSIDYEFDVPTVAEKALDVYIQAQNALVEKDEDKLHDLVTEKAFPEMMENAKFKTIRWNYIQSLEPPRIVQVRVQEFLSKTNSFAQVTVRLHSQQTLVVYDRFGRLMHGSEDTVKDVLEYIVFEKHLTHPDGHWKIHAKIIPDWMPRREAIKKTLCMPDIEKEYPEPPKDEPPPSSTKGSKEQEQPALAAA